MSEDISLTIEELAGRVGVPVRTVRFYISQGLLAGPGTRGKAATYGTEHYLRLQLIRRLAEQRLPLIEIRERLRSLSIDDVRALLVTEEKRGAEIDRAAASPRDYVAALLSRAQAGRTPALARQADTLRLPAPLLAQVCCPHPAAPAPMGWRRWELAPGVELHVREDAEFNESVLIDRLLRAARQR